MRDDVQTSNHFSIVRPKNYWYVLCRADLLKDKPRAEKLFGTPIVLFRGAQNQPVALLDRCAHRNVPLSAGRVVQQQIECGYHGWRYDNEGVCRLVPALCGASEGKARRVPSFATREQQGYVWVFATPGVTPDHEPFHIPHLDEPGFYASRYEVSFDATLFGTLENILDVPHTAFLHSGLFRSAPKNNTIKVRIQRFADRAEAHYLGEPVPKGLIGKMLAPGGGEVTHVDRFVVPSIAQVDYGLGTRSRLVVTDLLTPVDDFVTQLHTVVSIRLPFASLLAKLVAPIAVRVAQQDAVVLRLQTATTRAFAGEQYVSTDVDVLGSHILRLLKQAERGEVGNVDTPPVEEQAEIRV